MVSRTGRTPIRLLAFTGATQWGGAEIMLANLLAALGPRVEPTLLGVDAGVVRRIADRRPGLAWSLVPRITGKRDLSAIWAHRRAMSAAGPDVVQINLPVPFSEPYTILAALTLPHARVVAVEHLPMEIPWPGVRRLKALAVPRLAAHVAVGTAAAHEIERMTGLPPGSMRVVWNGVPPPSRPAVPAQHSGPLVIGAVGRLHQQKGFDVLLRAVAQLQDVRVVIVGDGPERQALEDLADDLDIGDRLYITGWTDDVEEHLSTFDVLAMPSRFEGLPLVLLEAMLSGRAVVATGVGSIPDAVHDGETGLLVPVNDPDALASALRRLQQDRGLRSELGAAAVRLAQERFTVSAMALAYHGLYDEVLGRTR